MAADADRRKFLKIATGALGGLVGAVTALPLLRHFFHPVGRKVVDSGSEPVDVIAVDQLRKGAPPVRLQIRARRLRDGWAAAQDVPLGAAYVRRDEAGKIVVLSSICPHLGCAIDYDPKEQQYRCPCHKSAFGLDGAWKTGPAKRGLDPLPHREKDGRLLVTWVQYRPDVKDREPV